MARSGRDGRRGGAGGAPLAVDEALLRSVFGGIQEGLGLIDGSYAVVQANPSMEAIFADGAPLAGRKCYEVFARRRSICPWCPSRKAPDSPPGTFIVRHPSARERRSWLELAPFALRDASGAVVGMVEHARDITQRREEEKRLEQSEQRYRALLDLAPDGIVVADTSGRIVEANGAFCELSGYTHEETIGLRFTKLPTIRLHDLPRFAALFSSLLAGSVPPSIPFEWIRKDGTQRWAEARVSLLRLEGKIVGLQAILRDTTEHVLAEKALRERDAKLQQAQKMEAVGRLAGGIAHDFNNILTALRGYAELLATDDSLNEDARGCTREILRASDRASALTRQLLSFSRRNTIQLRTVPLGRLIAEMEEMLRPLLGAGATLRISVDPRTPDVLADTGQIQQVVMSLVANSRDAMPDGGTIEISVTGVDLGDAEAARLDLEAGRWARLVVRDDGVGMDEETMRRIFEPFYSTKPRGKGTGLGLSTAYGIICQGGGKIWAESRPGEGTAMVILYPAAPAGAADESAPAGEPALPTGTESILVVEDEPPVRELARRVLARLGYEVSLASSGAEGIDAARTLPRLDLVLSDVLMPGMSGADLARELGSLRPGTRVLFMSGYLGETAEQAGPILEAGRLLYKPFTAAALARAVRGALDHP